jgi:hypothetical protein
LELSIAEQTHATNRAELLSATGSPKSLESRGSDRVMATLTDAGPLVALINRGEQTGALSIHNLTEQETSRMVTLMERYQDTPMPRRR